MTAHPPDWAWDVAERPWYDSNDHVERLAYIVLLYRQPAGIAANCDGGYSTPERAWEVVDHYRAVGYPPPLP